MAGLFMKELKIRGDLHRCLIIAPGSLTEQWQDELWDKFDLNFEIMTRDMIASSLNGNPFEHKNALIVRMDQLARNEELQERLEQAPEWDLVIVDEAHRMSGHYFGNEVKLTKRYRLGKVVGRHTRNLLLMTATPHNGKDEDFQIFLALLDSDRFEGRVRDGAHTTDPSDLMRRMIKEDLLKFDGKPLFPERQSYTVQYNLSDAEAVLYAAVTEYVREEMNRADRFAAEGEGQRRVNVGFALMILQRRLASSPEAIFQSLVRRKKRLESKLQEERLLLRGRTASEQRLSVLDELIDEDLFDDAYDEAPQDEREDLESRLSDNATAAATIGELEIEIKTLERLVELSKEVVRSGQDAKWAQLETILDNEHMKDEHGHRRKLVIFSEFRDTLSYLAARIRSRLGRAEAVVEIHGGVTRDNRRSVVHAFMNDPEVLVLIANDAAGEGVNLQRAHLMVNYDLPWNPNRLEQRFGRIHRIGQQEVCHLWNLIAKDTREGDVYIRLLEKLEIEKQALGGKVYDVLGRLFDQKALRELFMDAIRYGDEPEVRARMEQTLGLIDRSHLQQVLEDYALVHDSMDLTRVREMHREIEIAHAKRLQPHYIQSFFMEAFQRLGGQMHRREEGRYEITHVPQLVRERDRQIGQGAPVLKRYERVCFEKDHVGQTPRAEFISPGSPLLDAVISLTREHHAHNLKEGAVLIDERDPGHRPRLLFYLEHEITDGRRDRQGNPLVISKRIRFVEVDQTLEFKDGGEVPYLDCRPATKGELEHLQDLVNEDWMARDWDAEVMRFAIEMIVPQHLDDVRSHRLPMVEKTSLEVRKRLTREVVDWDNYFSMMREKERAGKNVNSRQAELRRDALAERLDRRLAELKLEKQIVAGTPKIIGGVLIIPGGLLERLGGTSIPQNSADEVEKKRVELLAMDAVMEYERQSGRIPEDVSAQRGIGHDIRSYDPATNSTLFIEVKGRTQGASEVTLTRTEIFCGFNTGEQFRLVIVPVDGEYVGNPIYIKGFPFREPGFGESAASFKIQALLDFQVVDSASVK